MWEAYLAFSEEWFRLLVTEFHLVIVIHWSFHPCAEHLLMADGQLGMSLREGMVSTKPLTTVQHYIYTVMIGKYIFIGLEM